MTIALWGAAAVAYGLALVRWLRVAQREHYLPRTVIRFAGRWWMARPANRVLVAVGVVALALSARFAAAGLVAALAAIAGPVGLSPKGRTGRLHWTARMRRLAVVVGGITAGLVLLGVLFDWAYGTLLASAFLLPALVDLALVAVAPLERRLSNHFVEQARETLDRVAPTTIAITGSFGKTTTKTYLGRLLRDSFVTLASPASFNNRLGLARAINEHLAAGTEMFLAEMGTYGKGEIADLVSWIRPRVGVITAIGPVHLERFGSLDEIAAAKAEILDGVATAVLNVDEPRLRRLVAQIPAGVEVVRCSIQDRAADVYVDAEGGGDVLVNGRKVAALQDRSAFAGNVACAVGAALAVGVPVASLEKSLADLPAADHRQTVSRGETGVIIIDDTYNSNPAGARSALAALQRLGTGGRRVVVTPGMVELGAIQHDENVGVAADASRIATDIVVVGRTNRSAWLEGAGRGAASVIVMESREEAVEWVRANLGDGDAVLYENDLPDHYP